MRDGAQQGGLDRVRPPQRRGLDDATEQRFALERRAQHASSAGTMRSCSRRRFASEVPAPTSSVPSRFEPSRKGKGDAPIVASTVSISIAAELRLERLRDAGRRRGQRLDEVVRTQQQAGHLRRQVRPPAGAPRRRGCARA